MASVKDVLSIYTAREKGWDEGETNRFLKVHFEAILEKRNHPVRLRRPPLHRRAIELVAIPIWLILGVILKS